MDLLTQEELREAQHILDVYRRRGGPFADSEVGRLLELFPRLLAEVQAKRLVQLTLFDDPLKPR